MEIFFFIFKKLFALFCLIGIGFIARRFLGIERDSIAKLIFYILVPIVFFNAVGKLSPDLNLFLLPLITALISGIVAVTVFYISKSFFDSSHRAILSFASANANVGYFLLPIIWEIFDAEAAGVFVIMVLGNVLYENTIGFFIASRGHYSARESLHNILKLPVLYALILGFIVCIVDKFSIPEMFNEVFNNMRGAYATLGMMIIGFGIADIKNYKLDIKFISSCLVVKFLFWPLLTLLFVGMDKYFFHLYDLTIHKMLIIFSVAPLAANNVVIATILNLHPDKVAAAVIISTIFALFYVPIVMVLFGLI